MNKLIICEGATDAILLSYYLGKIAGWTFCHKPPKELQLKEYGIEESINWYEKGKDKLLICAAGGKDRIKHFFESRILPTIEMLLVAIPIEHQGALETVLLDAIAEEPYDAHLIELVDSFVKMMRKEASIYINSNRKELKAKLGVTWAIQYPEKIFKLINEQILSVKWENSRVLKQCFSELIKI